MTCLLHLELSHEDCDATIAAMLQLLADGKGLLQANCLVMKLEHIHCLKEETQEELAPATGVCTTGKD